MPITMPPEMNLPLSPDPGSQSKSQDKDPKKKKKESKSGTPSGTGEQMPWNSIHDTGTGAEDNLHSGYHSGAYTDSPETYTPEDNKP